MIFKKYKAEVHLRECIKREVQLGIEKYFFITKIVKKRYIFIDGSRVGYQRYPVNSYGHDI